MSFVIVLNLPVDFRKIYAFFLFLAIRIKDKTVSMSNFLTSVQMIIVEVSTSLVVFAADIDHKIYPIYI